MAAASDYLRAFGTSALNGVATAAWVAAAELPAGQRRAVRAATTVAGIGIGWLAALPQDRPFTGTPAAGNDRTMAVALSMSALGAARMVAAWKLEKRWLTGLQRAGHPHPYRGLAWRMALLNAAGSLPAKLFEVRHQRV